MSAAEVLYYEADEETKYNLVFLNMEAYWAGIRRSKERAREDWEDERDSRRDSGNWLPDRQWFPPSREASFEW